MVVANLIISPCHAGKLITVHLHSWSYIKRMLHDSCRQHDTFGADTDAICDRRLRTVCWCYGSDDGSLLNFFTWWSSLCLYAATHHLFFIVAPQAAFFTHWAWKCTSPCDEPLSMNIIIVHGHQLYCFYMAPITWAQAVTATVLRMPSRYLLFEVSFSAFWDSVFLILSQLS